MNINSLPLDTIAMTGQAVLTQYQSPFSLPPGSLSLCEEPGLPLLPPGSSIAGGEANGDFSRLLAQISRLLPNPAGMDEPSGSDSDSDDDDTLVTTDPVVYGNMPDPAVPVVHSGNPDSILFQDAMPATILALSSLGSLPPPQPEVTMPIGTPWDAALENTDGILADRLPIANTGRLSFHEQTSVGETAGTAGDVSEKPTQSGHPLTGDTLQELVITEASRETPATSQSTTVPVNCAAISRISTGVTAQSDRMSPEQPLAATASSEWPGYFLVGSRHHARAVADLPELGKMIIQLNRHDFGVSVNVASRGDTCQMLSSDARTLLQLVTDSLHPAINQCPGQHSQPEHQEPATTGRETIDLSFTAHDNERNASSGTARNPDSAQSPPTQSLSHPQDPSADNESQRQFLPVQSRGNRAVLVDFRV